MYGATDAPRWDVLKVPGAFCAFSSNFPRQVKTEVWAVVPAAPISAAAWQTGVAGATKSWSFKRRARGIQLKMAPTFPNADRRQFFFKKKESDELLPLVLLRTAIETSAKVWVGGGWEGVI